MHGPAAAPWPLPRLASGLLLKTAMMIAFAATAASITAFLALVASAAKLPRQATVRESRPNAAWLQPQLMFHSLGSGRADVLGSDMSAFPLGIEVGRQFGPDFLVSAGLGYFPAANIESTQVTVGGRRYLTGDRWVPYVAAELGAIKTHEDDTGGQSHTNLFAAAGVGVELMLPGGLTCMTDLQLGPENAGRVGTTERVWHLSAWYRLGIGYRF